jgi:glycosyltransferase involved in cell wall biosynthesis
MKVLYDHQIFEWQRYGGVSRYFVELLRHFQAGGPVTAELALACSCNPYLRESGLAPAEVDFTTLPAVAERNRQRSLRHFLPRRKFRGKERLYRVLTALGYDQPEDIRRHQQANAQASVSRLQGGAFDVFHPTYYYPYFLPHLGDRPLVVTIHDMTHELYPEYFDLADGTLAFKRTLAERATLIIAISESTREDLIRILRVPGEKVKVVLHGHTRRPTAPASPAGDPPSLLYVGPRALYKNFYFFLSAIRDLLLEDSTLRVDCVGSDALTPAETRYIEHLGLTGKVRHRGSVDDATLQQLYAGARCFVFPSLHEGFGLPILEALDAGAITVASRTGALREVGGEACLYFDPRDADSIRGTLRQALHDEATRARLRAIAAARVAGFTWHRTARATAEVYAEAVDRHARAR